MLAFYKHLIRQSFISVSVYRNTSLSLKDNTLQFTRTEKFDFCQPMENTFVATRANVRDTVASPNHTVKFSLSIDVSYLFAKTENVKR